MNVKRPARSSHPSLAGVPSVIVHGISHVREALATGRPFRLLSAPGAATTLGVAWWQALAAAAGQPDDILDCGEDCGAAFEALRAGQYSLVLRGPFAATMASIAADAGSRILLKPPPALDLAHRHAPHQLAAWLKATNNR